MASGSLMKRRRSPRPPRCAQRLGIALLSGASILALLSESPAGASTLVSSKSGTATSGAGLLLAMSAGVVILGIVGFTVLTLSRRKRAPQQCAAEREALALAEQAVRYWEGALTHLRNSAPSDTDAVTPGESHASLLEKATVGHANAVRVRDESQMALIQCMASGSGPVPSPDALAKLEPLKFDADPPPPAASS